MPIAAILVLSVKCSRFLSPALKIWNPCRRKSGQQRSMDLSFDSIFYREPGKKWKRLTGEIFKEGQYHILHCTLIYFKASPKNLPTYAALAAAKSPLATLSFFLFLFFLVFFSCLLIIASSCFVDIFLIVFRFLAISTIRSQKLMPRPNRRRWAA